ncbi:MAG: hypothetical protein LUD07_12885 [Clostridiales bacterium]|nr:hypothetical protein [Clostridiales bacterium]
MAEATDKEGLLRQNLYDMGCSSDMVEKYVTLVKTRQVSLVLRMLAVDRKTILEELREKQKKIDCLDYLVFALEHGRY